MTGQIGFSMACLLVAAASVPLVLNKVPPNAVYGFRTKRTLADARVWYPVNAFAGYAQLTAACFSLALLWLMPEAIVAGRWVPHVTFLLPLFVSVMASFLYLRRLLKR